MAHAHVRCGCGPIYPGIRDLLAGFGVSVGVLPRSVALQHGTVQNALDSLRGTTASAVMGFINHHEQALMDRGIDPDFL